MFRVKPLDPWLLLVCLPASLLAEGERISSPQFPSQSSKAIIRRFPFQPPKFEPKSSIVSSSSNGDLVLLPQFTVNASLNRLTPKDVAAQEAKRKAETFNWRDAGTLLNIKGKTVTFKLEITPNPNEPPGWYDLISFSW